MMTSRGAEYYEPGDLIFTGEDFAHVISFNYRREYCDYCCTRNVHVKQCSQCQHVSYCNKQCQRSAWPVHKLECSSLLRYTINIDEYNQGFLDSEQFGNIFEVVLLTVRVIRKQKLNKGETFSETFNGLKITFDDIHSAWRVVDFYAIPHNVKRFGIMVDWIKDHFGDEIVLSSEEICDVLGKVVYNQAPLKYDKEFGIYLCLGKCFFQRGCKPNAVALPNGKGKYEIRATQRILKGRRKKLLSRSPHDRLCCYSNLREIQLLNTAIASLKMCNTTVPSDVRAEVDACLMHQSNVLGCLHIARLKLLVWKVLIDPQDLFSVKRSERSVILSIKKVYGEQSYELFTVYSRLTAIYASYKKLKIAKHYKEKRNELGRLYHQMPLNFESDALIEKMEQNNAKQK